MKTSIYLNDDLAVRARSSGLTYGELIRRGLESLGLATTRPAVPVTVKASPDGRMKLIIDWPKGSIEPGLYEGEVRLQEPAEPGGWVQNQAGPPYGMHWKET